MGASKSKESQAPKSKAEVDLAQFGARVDKVNISGLLRTHDDYVQRAVKNLFQAKTFQEVLLEANNTRNNLAELGAFKDLRVKIDVSNGAGATPNGYVVSFETAELSRITGSIGTEIGQNEGALTMELATPNILGRGERFSVNGSYGSGKTTDINLRLSKPFYHTALGDYKPETAISFFKHSAVFPWSSYKTENMGINLALTFRLPQFIAHSFQYEMAVVEILALGKRVPHFVADNCGPRLASLFRHVATIDQRDNPIFPSSGFFGRITNELSGHGGNVFYAMSNTHVEYTVPLLAGMALQGCGRFGIIRTQNGKESVPISNLFYMGGPLSVRGFQTAGAGPHIDGNAAGMQCYWASGLHLWAPLPFSSHFGRFSEIFRTHAFWNFGASNTLSASEMRSACGLGIAIRFGDRARIEFNYCRPLHKKAGDRVQRGFQFGLGYEFL